MLFGVEKRLMFMLSVDVHEQSGEVFQRRQRHHHARNAADAAAIGAQFARNGEDAVFAGRAQFRGQFLRAGAVGNVKERLYRRPFRAGAQKLPSGARAKRQRQAVHDDGLARAGLAGEYVEALGKLDGELLDEGDVANGYLQKHGAPRYRLMSAWKRLTTLSTASSERAMTRMVLSPAMVPRSSGHLSESMASAAA